MNEDTDAIRSAARQMVRELQLLDRKHCIEGFTFSECHLVSELELLGEATAKELGERLVLEKSTMSRLVNGLLEAGYLTRRQGREDGRRSCLV